MRSPAAQEASRRNGAKSRGPRSAKGKAVSARNAFRHGLRARQPILAANLPAWVKAFEAEMIAKVGYINPERREYLDRLLQALVLVERTDHLIAEEMARLHALGVVSRPSGTEGARLALPGDLRLSALRTLVSYRKRFRAQRDICIRKIQRWGRLKDPKKQ